MKYEIINEKKKKLGLNNAQIAERAGVTLSTVDKITSGANQNPKLDTLFAIADVLGLTLDDFDDRIKSIMSKEATEMAGLYDHLDNHGKRVVKAVLDLEVERCAGAVTSPTITVTPEELAGKADQHEDINQGTR